MEKGKSVDRDEVRAHLTGPISSIATPFLEDGDVDYDGLRKQIDFVLEGGSQTVLLTAGDSHYICMSEAEIAEVTKVACEHTAGRGMVVAADRFYGTTQAVAFAEFARNAGADVVMALPPGWGKSSPETLTDHYGAVSEQLPVMIVTGAFIQHGAAFGLETVRRSLDKYERVVAVKDDMCGEFAKKLCLAAHDQVAVFSGGQKTNHMSMFPYGCDGYMSTFIRFKPEVVHRYWKAIEEEDLDEARAVIRDVDMPYFDQLMKLPSGWNAGMHGTLELFGMAGRWRRKPYCTITDAEMEDLKAFFSGIGLL